MGFEITDQEAQEVLYTVGRKLSGINILLKRREKEGVKTFNGKPKLIARLPVMTELVERLKDRYGEK